MTNPIGSQFPLEDPKVSSSNQEKKSDSKVVNECLKVCAESSDFLEHHTDITKTCDPMRLIWDDLTLWEDTRDSVSAIIDCVRHCMKKNWG